MKLTPPRSATLNRTRQIGIEHEMTVPLVGHGTGSDVQRTLAHVLTANGIRSVARGYSHDPLPPGVDLAVEYDSSVRGETRYAGITWFPVEIKTRILNGIGEWEQVVPKALDICRYMGARVNHSCGHHVHLGLPEVEDRPKVIRSLHALVKRVEPVVYGMVAPSRLSSGYCRPLDSDFTELQDCKSLEEFGRSLQEWSRYHGLNLTHVLDDPPHVEFRYHQGTLDAAKARHWLRFLLQLTEHAATRNCQSFEQPLSNDRNGFERMATAIGLRVNSKIYRHVSDELAETASYLLRRWKHFNGQPMQAPRQTLTAAAAEREVA